MATKLPAAFNTKKDDRRLSGFKLAPAGDYIAKIVETGKVPTKETAALAVSKRKHRFNLTWEITQGEHKGTKIFEGLNLEHQDDKTREYAEERLLSIQDACGVVNCDDLDDLKGIECSIKVSVKKGDAQYPDSNAIRSYASAKGVKKAGAASASRFNDDDEEDEDEKPAAKTVSKPAPTGDKPKRKVASF